MRKICTKKRATNCAKCQMHRKAQQTRGLQADRHTHRPAHRRQTATSAGKPAHRRQTATPAGRPAHHRQASHTRRQASAPQADRRTAGRPAHHRQTAIPAGKPAHRRQASAPQAGQPHPQADRRTTGRPPPPDRPPTSDRKRADHARRAIKTRTPGRYQDCARRRAGTVTRTRSHCGFGSAFFN